jgi:membrane-bound serine protease (ClpP class)
MNRPRKMRSMRSVRALLYLAAILLSLLSGFTAQAQNGGSRIDLLVVEGAITPIVKEYILRGIEQAERDKAAILLIQMDTPGGSVTLTKDITQRMTAARVPIVVYIAPAGAHAASAGTFITLAGHVAAMAPGTSIGAASPVAGGGEDLPETARDKEIAILEADIKGLAKGRGEDAVEWAALAVREAKAATEDEALNLGVIDIVASSVPDLLQQLDGMEITVAGEPVTLHTTDLPINELPMSPLEQLLHTITDPNIAFILMTLGLNGILFELSNPGGYFAGVVGGICLLLALYAMGVLSVNYTGLLFVALAFVLFIVDIKAPTHGILTIGGIASFIIGSLILFNSSYAQVSISLVVTVGLATGAFFAFVVAKAIGAQRRQPTTGSEALIGQIAVVRTPLTPAGVVLVKGELWTAETEAGTIERDQRVVILRREGFRLWVKPIADEGVELTNG